MRKSIRLQGVYVGSRVMFEEMNRALAAHAVTPVIDRTYPLRDAVEAFRYLEDGHARGKIVITVI